METEGFLTGARGPVAGLFFAMVPDLDGRARLSGKLETVAAEEAEGKAKAKKKATVEVVRNEARTRQWQALRDRFVAKFPEDKDSADKVFQQQLRGTEQYLAEQWPDIQVYFAALDRFEKSKKTSPDTAFQRKRDRDTMTKLRGEAKAWLSELDARQSAYKAALRDLAPTAGGVRDPFAASWNPLEWPQMEQIQFAITWGLTAIGVCLMLGFCTRPAALGGGLFMLSVVLSQPSYPGVIPADPPQLGHALLVNKDFIEMLALFLLATTHVGRWGGLDYFLDHCLLSRWLSKPVCACGCGSKKEG